METKNKNLSHTERIGTLVLMVALVLILLELRKNEAKIIAENDEKLDKSKFS